MSIQTRFFYQCATNIMLFSPLSEMYMNEETLNFIMWPGML